MPPVTGGRTVETGQTVDGKYRVGNRLGQGGMAAVFAAVHVELDKEVALKVLRPELTQSDTIMRRFAQEARAAAKLTSEHVARVIDVGSFAAEGEDIPYIVMERLEGQDLGALLKRQKRLPPQQAVDYVMQALEAIAEAHAKGIVHRDLKPSNLFLAELPDGPMIKVLDFGIAKALSDVESAKDLDHSLTQTQDVLGSPRYMSPEQLRSSAQVGIESDIWSLGVVLYELLGGKAPFAGSSLAELHAAILERSPRPLTKRVVDIDPDLARTVERCLDKDPQRRFRNVVELGRALAPHGAQGAPQSLEFVESWEGSMPDPARVTAPFAGEDTIDPDTDFDALEHATTAAYRPSDAAQKDTATNWDREAEPPNRLSRGLLALAVIGLIGLGALARLGLGWGDASSAGSATAGSASPAPSAVAPSAIVTTTASVASAKPSSTATAATSTAPTASSSVAAKAAPPPASPPKAPPTKPSPPPAQVAPPPPAPPAAPPPSLYDDRE